MNIRKYRQYKLCSVVSEVSFFVEGFHLYIVLFFILVLVYILHSDQGHKTWGGVMGNAPPPLNKSYAPPGPITSYAPDWYLLFTQCRNKKYVVLIIVSQTW